MVSIADLSPVVTAPAVPAPVDPIAPVDSVTAPDPTAHVLRLCLDLQLDAMLLALGAGATQSPGRPDEPWRRWTVEDLQTVLSLAVDVARRGVALPPSFGTEPIGAPRATVDRLAARYESMVALLADLPGAPGAAGAAGPALDHCLRRLQELGGSGWDDAGAAGTGPLADEQPARRYLPGELLG